MTGPKLLQTQPAVPALTKSPGRPIKGRLCQPGIRTRANFGNARGQLGELTRRACKARLAQRADHALDPPAGHFLVRVFVNA